MAGKTLRVLARGTAMVPNHLAHQAGIARFIGRTWDESRKDEAQGIAGGWVPSTEPTVIEQNADVSVFAEYIRALRDGDLWPADAETARMSGLTFDPAYGGEYAAPVAPTAPAKTPSDAPMSRRGTSEGVPDHG